MKHFYIISLVILILDQLSKTLIRQSLEPGQVIHILPVFSITHVTNTGMAFGMFPGLNWILLLVSLAFMVFIIWYAKKLLLTDVWSPIFLGLVMGGAFGNIVDRFVFGHVTDFLDFYVGVRHWPSFNVADSAICVGAALLLFRSLRGGEKEV